MSLRVRHIFDKYIDQDPIKVMRNSTLKSAAILFSFLAIAFTFDFNRNLIVLCLLFLANMIASVLMGNIETKRKVFFLYTISAMIIVHVSTYVHPIFEKEFLLILPFVYFFFWLRRFGEVFLYFPMMLIVMVCITFIKFPLFDYNHWNFIIWSIILATIFYFVLIRGYKPMTNEDIELVVKSLMKLFIKSYKETFDNAKFRRFTQTKIMDRANEKFNNIIALQTHGMMLLRKSKIEEWRFFCYNLVMLNRLLVRYVLNYKKFSINYSRMGFSNNDEVQSLSKDLERMFLETLQLGAIIVSHNQNAWKNKIRYIEHLKFKFELGYIEGYKQDKEKRDFLFSCILLLDDIFFAIENTREAYNDFLKR